MKSPLKIVVLYFTMTEDGKINLVWVGSVDIFRQCRVKSKVITSRKYIIFGCNFKLITGLMNVVYLNPILLGRGVTRKMLDQFF